MSNRVLLGQLPYKQSSRLIFLAGNNISQRCVGLENLPLCFLPKWKKLYHWNNSHGRTDPLKWHNCTYWLRWRDPDVQSVGQLLWPLLFPTTAQFLLLLGPPCILHLSTFWEPVSNNLPKCNNNASKLWPLYSSSTTISSRTSYKWNEHPQFFMAVWFLNILCLMLGVCGAWYMVYGAWYCVTLGIWCYRCFWCLVHGSIWGILFDVSLSMSLVHLPCYRSRMDKKSGCVK